MKINFIEIYWIRDKNFSTFKSLVLKKSKLFNFLVIKIFKIMEKKMRLKFQKNRFFAIILKIW